MTEPFVSKNSPIRDCIAIVFYRIARQAYNFFARLTVISPNSSSAITSMEIDPIKDGIRFSTERELANRKIPLSSFFIRRQDLERGLEALEIMKEKLNDQEKAN